MRFSTDQRDAKGRVINGFDYALQVWVKDGIIQPCGHPSRMRLAEPTCCNQNKYALFKIEEVRGHEGV